MCTREKGSLLFCWNTLHQLYISTNTIENASNGTTQSISHTIGNFHKSLHVKFDVYESAHGTMKIHTLLQWPHDWGRTVPIRCRRMSGTQPIQHLLLVVWEWQMWWTPNLRVHSSGTCTCMWGLHNKQTCSCHGYQLLIYLIPKVPPPISKIPHISVNFMPSLGSCSVEGEVQSCMVTYTLPRLHCVLTMYPTRGEQTIRLSEGALIMTPVSNAPEPFPSAYNTNKTKRSWTHSRWWKGFS